MSTPIALRSSGGRTDEWRRQHRRAAVTSPAIKLPSEHFALVVAGTRPGRYGDHLAPSN